MLFRNQLNKNMPRIVTRVRLHIADVNIVVSRCFLQFSNKPADRRERHVINNYEDISDMICIYAVN